VPVEENSPLWLYGNRPDLNWTAGAAAVSNHQVVQTLDEHPELRDFLGLGEQIAAANGMIKSAAGGASYLVEQANRRTDLTAWYEGIIDGAGLRKGDPRLQLRRVMFNMARRHAGQPLRRRDTREHVALYIKAFNAWHTDEPLPQLRFTPRHHQLAARTGPPPTSRVPRTHPATRSSWDLYPDHGSAADGRSLRIGANPPNQGVG
jgi:hypothetical protein